jgi:quinol monooxygenase YgiN
MVILHVQAKVKPESVEAFRQATIVNASSSRRTEPGVVRFDVLQQRDDPTRFMLIEVYRNDEAMAAHKETPHYQVWRDTVTPMMAEPRMRTEYANTYPEDKDW